MKVLAEGVMPTAGGNPALFWLTHIIDVLLCGYRARIENMTKEELVDFLRANLVIDVDARCGMSDNFSGRTFCVSVTLKLGGEELCTSESYDYLPSND